MLGDPLAQAIQPDAPMGLLGIDINHRRRNRLSAHVKYMVDGAITLNVDKSFGNCPQYIQTRSVDFIRNPSDIITVVSVHTLSRLDEAAEAMIRASDTFFVSSNINTVERPDIEGVDVIHRGGMPGLYFSNSNRGIFYN